jgi:hypothetical protein
LVSSLHRQRIKNIVVIAIIRTKPAQRGKRTSNRCNAAIARLYQRRRNFNHCRTTASMPLMPAMVVTQRPQETTMQKPLSLLTL